jgi:hypothetical protein
MRNSLNESNTKEIEEKKRFLKFSVYGNFRGLTFILILSSLLVSCNGSTPLPPYVYETNPHYSFGYAQFYGDYYSNAGISNNVLTLSLFSDSLSITDEGELKGFGQYLYLEDIFISPSDTLLPAGTYTINNSGEPFTVAPGKTDTVDNNYFPIGAMITYFEPLSTKSTFKFITEGTFTVDVNTEYVYTINFQLKTAEKDARGRPVTKDLKGSFTGQLPHFDESFSAPQQLVKHKLNFLRHRRI